MRAVLNITIVLSLLITSFSVGFLIYHYFTFTPSYSSNRDTGNSETKIGQNSSNSLKTDLNKEEQQEVPQGVLSQIEHLSSIVTAYFARVKNGPSTYPALVFKVLPQKEELKVYLLTYYPMEWPFVKTFLLGKELGSPRAVYQCPGGLLLIEYTVKGLFPVEAERGEIGRYGALSTWTENSFYLELFSSEKGCSNNGFVFNLSGEFAGVCFGGKLYRATDLYNSIPEECRIIYQKEGENGDLQSQNGQLVR